MQCVILAGGLATRMRPYTEKIPKSLLSVAGHPFLKHQLDSLSTQGITDVIMCIGYKGEMIREFAGDGGAWRIQLRYVDEGSNLRGTAGALKFASQTVALDKEFFVLYGDSYLVEPMGPVWEYFQNRSESALMTVLKNENQWEKSNVRFENSKVLLYEKNIPDPLAKGLHYVDYGLSILRRNVLEKEVPDGVKFDLADVFHKMSMAGDLAGFEMHHRFFEIGSPSGLTALEDFLKAQHTSEA